MKKKTKTVKEVEYEEVTKNNNKVVKAVKDVINDKRYTRLLKTVVCLLIILFLCSLIIKGFVKLKNGKYPSYPIVYQKATGDMKIFGDKYKEGIKLSSSDSIDYVVYANTTDRYVLYEKNDSLYLFDNKKRAEKIKVLSEAKEYMFSTNDKYIVVVSKKNELYVYDYKKATKLENEISSVKAVSDNYVVYVKAGSLYIRDLKAKKSEKIKIEDKFGSYVQIAPNEKTVTYINKQGELIKYDIKKKKGLKIASSVIEYYCDKNCNKMYYVTNDDTQTLYYYNGKEGLKIASELYGVSAIDVDHKIAVYAKSEKKDFALYFQKEDKTAVKVEEDLKSMVYVKIFKGRELYYINSEDNLRYAKISGRKISTARTLAEDVSDNLMVYSKGFVFLSKIQDNAGELYIAKGGRAKKIDEDVYKTNIKVNTKGNKIFYLKDYGSSSGDLYYTSGSKPKLISSDVYRYQAVKNNVVYYIKEFDIVKRFGDLYVYNGKSKLIEKEVMAISSIPNYFELNK